MSDFLKNFKSQIQANLGIILFLVFIIFTFFSFLNIFSQEPEEAQKQIDFTATLIQDLENKYLDISAENLNTIENFQSEDTFAQKHNIIIQSLEDIENLIETSISQIPDSTSNQKSQELKVETLNFLNFNQEEIVNPWKDNIQANQKLQKDYLIFSKFDEALKNKNKAEIEKSLEAGNKILDLEFQNAENFLEESNRSQRLRELDAFRRRFVQVEEILTGFEDQELSSFFYDDIKLIFDDQIPTVSDISQPITKSDFLPKGYFENIQNLEGVAQEMKDKYDL